LHQNGGFSLGDLLETMYLRHSGESRNPDWTPAFAGVTKW